MGGLIQAPASGTRGIVLATEQVVPHKFGKITFPAGLYLPEASSEEGIYYAAPQPIHTGGVMKGGREHGGLFLRPDGGQAAWVGQPGYQLQQAPSTLLGARGVERPIRYGLLGSVQYRPQ